MNTKDNIPEKTIERLALYRRLLSGLKEKGLEHIYSHQLAEFISNTPAQIRRDIMLIGYVANSKKGYTIDDLLERIDTVLSNNSDSRIALVGIGNLGRAILAYFNQQHSALRIVAAFDIEESRVNRVISGCRCYPMRMLKEKMEKEKITLGIITVPGQSAQEVADNLSASGIKGILNFAPVPVKVPEDVYADRIDITTAIEKVAYFAHRSVGEKMENR